MISTNTLSCYSIPATHMSTYSKHNKMVAVASMTTSPHVVSGPIPLPGLREGTLGPLLLLRRQPCQNVSKVVEETSNTWLGSHSHHRSSHTVSTHFYAVYYTCLSFQSVCTPACLLETVGLFNFAAACPVPKFISCS